MHVNMIKYCAIATDDIVFRSRVEVNVYIETTAVKVRFSDPSVLALTFHRSSDSKEKSTPCANKSTCPYMSSRAFHYTAKVQSQNSVDPMFLQVVKKYCLMTLFHT